MVPPFRFPSESTQVTFDFNVPGIEFYQDKVILIKNCVLDGDWVNSGDPLYLLQLAFKGGFGHHWVRATTSGYSQRAMNLKQKIVPGDTLGLIHPQGVYSKENSPLRKSFRYFFNASKYKYTFGQTKHFPLGHLQFYDPEARGICEWVKKDYDLVKEGEIIFTVKKLLYKRTNDSRRELLPSWYSQQIEPFHHKAEKTGFLQTFSYQNDDSLLIPKKLTYIIHDHIKLWHKVK